MSNPGQASLQKELVVLVADKDARMAVEQLLLRRHRSLQIRQLERGQFDVFVHAEHDPGCRKIGAEFLRPYVHTYRYALVLFDREGCGSSEAPAELERAVEQSLARNGWPGRSAAVVIDPELEIWVWANSPLVAEALGWQQQRWPALRRWLDDQGLWPEGQAKPPAPKEAMQQALRKAGKPWSAAIFKQLAARVGIKGCTDPAFSKLREVLQSWFPP